MQSIHPSSVQFGQLETRMELRIHITVWKFWKLKQNELATLVRQPQTQPVAMKDTIDRTWKYSECPNLRTTETESVYMTS